MTMGLDGVHSLCRRLTPTLTGRGERLPGSPTARLLEPSVGASRRRVELLLPHPVARLEARAIKLFVHHAVRRLCRVRARLASALRVVPVELLGRGPGLRPVIAGAASHCDREDGADDPGQGESRRRHGCSPTSAERRTRAVALRFRSTPAPPARTLGLSPLTPALPPLCRRRPRRTRGAGSSRSCSRRPRSA